MRTTVVVVDDIHIEFMSGDHDGQGKIRVPHTTGTRVRSKNNGRTRTPRFSQSRATFPSVDLGKLATLASRSL